MNGRAARRSRLVEPPAALCARARWLGCRGPDRPPSRDRVSLMRAGRRSTVSAIVLALAVASFAFARCAGSGGSGVGSATHRRHVGVEQRLVVRAGCRRRPRRARGDRLLAGRVRDRSRTVHGRLRANELRPGSDVVDSRPGEPGREARRSRGARGVGRLDVRGVGDAAELRQLRPVRAPRPVLPREHRERMGQDRRADEEEGPRRLPVDRGVRQARLRRVGRRQHRSGARRSQHATAARRSRGS